ncbi:unnamed protein product [Caenorhabditis auriculariae]|uniref:Alpha-1,3-glucosyltransferase n=1 Tax=Caenorhabditis auriculariae TaxID=2777116 RepID=A0A8S1HR74_9PELO|nr:unnamed protein product [Caenorhabditis auriculariae]
MDNESPWTTVLLVGSALMALKAALIPAYVSTDFEVHRNWMAVTWNRPLRQWYTENTSQWTLDYPPFFAFFELGLAKIASFSGLGDVLQISEKPIFNERILFFQRISVMFTDIFYLMSCALIAFKSTHLFDGFPRKLQSSARKCCFVLLACNPALFLVDSIHFQYNSMMTSLFLVSLFFVNKRRFLLGALFFGILLNFKHIYLYYALAYVTHYLWNYFEIGSFSISSVPIMIRRGVSLGVVLLVPFATSLGGFLAADGLVGLQNILKRLFPVSRGLTHAFWAPNFWALYNLTDLVLYRILTFFRIGTYPTPTYTSGLVQEYDHSVLPSVSTFGSTTTVLLTSLLVLGLCKRRADFSVHLTLAAYVFFFFGYHVHEKAILLMTVPLTVAAFKNVDYVPPFVFLSVLSSFSLFPLLFTPFEIMIKYSVALCYISLVVLLAKKSLMLPRTFILPNWSLFYFAFLTAVELYASLIHNWIWSGKYEFFPLMAISVGNALGVLFGLIWLFFISTQSRFSIRRAFAKWKCLCEEQLIRDGAYGVQEIESEDDVKIVAGADISASKTSPNYAIVALSVFSYPRLEHLKTLSETVVLTTPYFPGFLALRESAAIVDVIKHVIASNPQFRPDVILCDGNGQFHPRKCGLACHIGAKTGIASVGVAKNLLANVVYDVTPEEHRAKVDVIIRELDNLQPKEAGWIPFDFISPVLMNVGWLSASKNKVYISPGYGIDLATATKVVFMSSRNSKTCEPIREADLYTRELLRKEFD